MRLFALLLWLYPASFRAEYGDEMAALFARRLRQASPPFGPLSVWVDTIADLLVTAAQTHWDILQQDVRYCIRGFRRAPGFVISAILVAALGVGATTSAYTITDHVLLRPLPFPEPERLVQLWEDMSPGRYKQMEPSPANYRDWKRMSSSFETMAASTYFSAALTTAGEPQQVDGAKVSSDLLPMLGAKASMGRLFSPEDDRPGATAVVVLSEGLWRDRFGTDLGIVGRRVLLADKPFVVIGVMEKSFRYPTRQVQFWTAFRFANSDFEDRTDNYIAVVARLRTGVSIAQARSEMRMVSETLRRQYPKENEHVGVTIESLRDQVSARARLMLYALLGASFCVLLIACANLAGLLLAKAMVRRKELAVRAALGAGRERLARQMLTESLLLSLVGGIFGIFIASVSLPLFSALVPNALPIEASPAMDGRVLFFALLLTGVTGISFGALPALRATRDSSEAGLREGSRQGVGGRKERLRAGLVIAEISISFVLLIGAGLLIRALWQLEQIQPGFEAQSVVTLRTTLPTPKYDVTARRTEFYQRVIAGVRSMPGVTNAAYTSGLPFIRRGGVWPVTIAGQPPNADRAFHQATLRFITPGYFETLRIPLLRGRGVSESDAEKSQYVAVVSQSFVREYWPDQDPIGRQFTFAFASRTVVGVVGDVRVRGMEGSSEPQVYVPSTQVPDESLVGYTPRDLAIRSSASLPQLLPAVRRIISDVDAQQPVSDVQTLSDVVKGDTAPRRLQVQVLSGFALVAIFLAGIGIHGLLSFAVSSRSQEIGVRMAIGATSGRILRMVLAESAILAAAGMLLGVVFGYLGGRTLSSLLAGINPGDPQTFAVASALVAGMTVAGSILPALRAIRIDPIVVIRSE